MKFLNWMQSKINGKQSAPVSSKKPIGVSIKNNVVMQESRKDELSDWPHGLLAIGTFGNTDVNKCGQESLLSSKRHGRSDCNDNQIIEEEISPLSLSEVLGDDDLDDFTPEEVGKLQEELKKLLSRKPKPALTEEDQRKTLSGRRGVNLLNLPLDKFLNCPSSLEVERKVIDINDSPTQHELRRSLSVIANMGKNLSPERTKSIRKKSVSFLLKKMFVCRSGFPPPAPPSFRDSIPESRIEKLLRAMINKNLYCPKNSPTTPTAKKFLENENYYLETDKENADKGDDDEQQLKEKINDGCRWDKTDDDYIVLEI
ncbi:hypothetical protein MKX01_003121 [Papaver californicum]|nr:hypothetical protein MKX01_003121 [Papaver californicum]